YIGKSAAIGSPLVVTNTAYYLSECNGAKGLSGRGLVIGDEADTLESQLMNHVSIEISPRRMEKYGWQPPDKVTKEESWAEWLSQKIPQVSSLIRSLPSVSDKIQ